MNKYSVMIQYDSNDNIYIASVPELRGCKAHGDTPEEALQEIKIAFQLWIESAQENGITIPEPMLYLDEKVG